MKDTYPEQPSFEAVYREHFDAVARFAEGRGAEGMGEDVAQEALLRLWLKGDELDHADAAPWLVTVSKNLVVDRYRAAQARPVEVHAELFEERVAMAAGEYQATGAVHDTLTLNQALAAMSEEQRVAIELRYLSGYTTKEVSEKLGIPEGTIKSRCFFAFAAARAALRKAGVTADMIDD